jgi:hypothetical protein
MQKFLRYLRIAFSATCLIACVLLIVLWVRSYFVHDALGFTVPGVLQVLQIDSGYGGLGVSAARRTRQVELDWGFASWEPGPNIWDSNWAFKRWTDMSGSYVVVGFPDWFLILIGVTLSVVPWIPWSRRFSLRTLLIITTLVAMVLGLAVYTFRK